MAKVSCKHFDINNLSLSKDTTTKATYKVLYDGNPLKLSTPKLECRNGITKSDTYTFLDLLCDETLSAILESIDAKVISYVTENSATILGKKRSRVNVEDIYKDTVRGTHNSAYLRTRLSDGLRIYDKQRRDISETNEHVEKDDTVQALLRLDCVRAASGTVKCNWYLDQLKLQKIVSDCLISDSESDSDSETVRDRYHNRVSALTDEDY